MNSVATQPKPNKPKFKLKLFSAGTVQYGMLGLFILGNMSTMYQRKTSPKPAPTFPYSHGFRFNKVDSDSRKLDSHISGTYTYPGMEKYFCSIGPYEAPMLYNGDLSSETWTVVA